MFEKPNFIGLNPDLLNDNFQGWSQESVFAKLPWSYECADGWRGWAGPTCGFSYHYWVPRPPAFRLVGLLGSSLRPLILLLTYSPVLTNCQRPPPAPPGFSQGISKGQHLRIGISRIQWNSHLDFIAIHGCKTNSQMTAWQTRMLMCFKNICHSLSPYSKADTGLDVGLFYNNSLRVDFIKPHFTDKEGNGSLERLRHL